MFASYVTDTVNTIIGRKGEALNAVIPINPGISFRGL
jgi:hypothetical protein